MSELVDTWSNRAAVEDSMTDGHAWIWREMIRTAVPGQLTGSRVLDLGCNQGGFLRLLYDTRPFAEGVGVDLAKDRVTMAESAKGDRPLRYLATNQLGELGERFDVIFSHEVIYLIEDLADHATQIAAALKPGATYHAVTCCHANNPLWPEWRAKVQEFSNIPVPNHSVADIVCAFQVAGFDTRVSRFLAAAQIPMEGDSDYFPSTVDRLEVFTRWKLMFHFTL